MFFFEPYTPGEITFYALCYGGYKLHKKMKEKVKEYKEELAKTKRQKWLEQYLPLGADNFIRALREIDDAYKNGRLTDLEHSLRKHLLFEEDRKEREAFLKSMKR